MGLEGGIEVDPKNYLIFFHGSNIDFREPLAKYFTTLLSKTNIDVHDKQH
jgi:hypothetical protein